MKCSVVSHTFPIIMQAVHTSQMYGKHRSSHDIKERYLANCIESLLTRYRCEVQM